MPGEPKAEDRPSRTIEVNWSTEDEDGRTRESMAVFHLGRLSKWSTAAQPSDGAYTSLRISARVGKPVSVLLSDVELHALAQALVEWSEKVSSSEG